MKKSLFITLLLLGVIIVMNATNRAEDNGKEKSKGLDPANMDKSVSPAVDFYQYANGNWLRNNPIPDEYSRWGSFSVLAETNYKVLKNILEKAAGKQSPKGSVEQQIGDFYKAGMDTAKIEADGAKAIEPLLKEIDGVKSLEEMTGEIASLHKKGIYCLFGFGAGADAKNSNMEIAQLGQAGLGLPERDYYLNEDARSKETRERYVKHVQNMFVLLGENSEDAAKDAAKVMEIETRMAKSFMNKLDLRDPNKTYNKMSPAKLAELMPGYDWNSYFTGVGIKNPGDINVNQPEYFKAMTGIIKEFPLSDWKTYMKWHAVHSMAGFLSNAFENEQFEFYSKYLRGSKVMQPRWKRVMLAADELIGETLGQLYVKEVFPPEAKDRAKKMVDGILEAMGERIRALDWMSEGTKQQALKKLATFTVKIGYPDKWKDYSSLTITDASYLQNALNANEYEFRRDINKIGKPVDRTEWGMTPQTVNAYYNPLQNEIVFPAAILQPPFFNYEADDALNYGGIGAVIGHEITHGFDDKGRLYDAQGNIKDWWTKEDGEKFDKEAALIVKQYNEYTPVDSLHINGALTQGENIADLGGLNIALTALKKTDQYRKNSMIDGFTTIQRFFLSWAQIWRSNTRKEFTILMVNTDPHSPEKYRVLGPLSNMPEFWEAFNVKQGDPMTRPADALVKIW
ncbi:MAG: M13 family metallopeptidase [Ignavibacteriales bacterium]